MHDGHLLDGLDLRSCLTCLCLSDRLIRVFQCRLERRHDLIHVLVTVDGVLRCRCVAVRHEFARLAVVDRLARNTIVIVPFKGLRMEVDVRAVFCHGVIKGIDVLHPLFSALLRELSGIFLLDAEFCRQFFEPGNELRPIEDALNMPRVVIDIAPVCGEVFQGKGGRRTVRPGDACGAVIVRQIIGLCYAWN